MSFPNKCTGQCLLHGRRKSGTSSRLLTFWQGRSPIRLFLITLLLGSLAPNARADLMVYSMSGKITNAVGYLDGRPYATPFAKGDRVTWTLQYDRSMPASNVGSGVSNYSPSGPLITNLVDLTKGMRFNLDYYPPWSQPTLTLSSSAAGSSFQAVLVSHGIDTGESATLNLLFKSRFSSSQLKSMQLSTLPLDRTASSLHYDSGSIVGGWSFAASVNSISAAPLTGVPEPGSIVLLAIGFFALLRFCRPLRAGAFAEWIARRLSLRPWKRTTNGESWNRGHSGRNSVLRWSVGLMTLLALSFTSPVKASQIFGIGNATPWTVYYVQGESFTPSIAGNGGLGTPLARPDGSVLLTRFTIDFPRSLTPTPPSRLYIYPFAPTIAQVKNDGDGSLGVGSYTGGGAYAFNNLKLAFSSKYFAILPAPVSIFDGAGNRYAGGVDLFAWNGRVQEGNGQYDIGFHAQYTTQTPEPSSLILSLLAGLTLAGLRFVQRAQFALLHGKIIPYRLPVLAPSCNRA